MTWLSRIENALFVSLAILVGILIYRLIIQKWILSSVSSNIWMEDADPYNKNLEMRELLIDIQHPIHVHIKILNDNEEVVRSVIDREIEAGKHKLEIDVSGLPKGYYWYQMTTVNQKITKKFGVA